MVWRPFYFGNLIVDPKDRKQDLQTRPHPAAAARTAARAFNVVSGGAHGDFHDVWINPKNPNIVIAGDDGGLWRSEDGGNRWKHQMNLPVSQFYHVSTDNCRSLPRVRRAAGQQFVGGRFVLSGRHQQLALGKHVRRRRLLDVRGPCRSGLHLCGSAGRRDRPRQPLHARDARHQAACRIMARRSCASTGTRRST